MKPKRIKNTRRREIKNIVKRDEIKANNNERFKDEAKQVAAMALKFMICFCEDEEG